jgi:hypothetical protein
MLAEIPAPRGFDTRLATVGYIVRGLLDDSLPNRHTSQGTANGMTGPVERCSPDNHTCSFVSRPLVKCVCWYQASSQLQRIAKRGLSRSCFRLCVNRAGRNRGVFRPMRNETPFHQRNLSNMLFRMLTDHRNELGWRNDISRRDIPKE